MIDPSQNVSPDGSPGSSPQLTAGRMLLWGATLPLAGVLFLLGMSGIGGLWLLGAGIVLTVVCVVGDLLLRKRRRER